jgi:LacI family transcriptional regulator
MYFLDNVLSFWDIPHKRYVSVLMASFSPSFSCYEEISMSRNRRVSIMVGLDWPLGHHHQIFAGIQRYAQECGRWECLINPYADLLIADLQKDSGINGIIARTSPGLAELAKAANIPLVNVWQNSTAQGVPHVFPDNLESGKMAAEHLLARGLRSFAFLGLSGLSSSQNQAQGLSEVLAAKGHSLSKCLIDPAYDATPENWQCFQTKLGQWMDSWSLPIGVLAHTDFMCRFLAEACRSRNLEIPQSVTLIGSGNEVLIDTAAHPTLSSIDFGYERIGHRAAQLLDNLMDGALAPTEPLVLPPIAFVVRQSSDAFVVDDPIVSQALRFITDTLHLGVNVDQVAAHVATTRRTLSRRFNRSLGQTIHDAITQLRLERVKRQLVNTKAALKTVAVECGFRDAIHLCKVFQRVEKTSPSEYRASRAIK